MASSTLITELRKHGYSATKPRQVIFDALLLSGPVTVSELVSLVDSKLNRASVYRTVALFEKVTFIRRISFGWKYKIELSDTFTHHHHHVRCRDCNMVIDIQDDDDLRLVVEKMAKSTKFTKLLHELEISGLCESCSK